MKRRFILVYVLLLCAALLGACGRTVRDPGELTMFGIDWSATPSDAQKALKLPEDSLWGGVLTVENRAFFGVKAQRAEFQFLEDSRGMLRLSRITLIYPDDADMARVRKTLEKAYGPGLESYTAYTAKGDAPLEEHVFITTDHFAFWHSDKTMSACAADPDFPLREDWDAYVDGMQKQDEKAGAEGKLVEFYGNSPLVRLFWSDDGSLPHSSGDASTRNMVVFDAGRLATMR